MGDMGDVHRRDMVEEVAEEQVPPPNFTGNPVDDTADDDSDTEESLFDNEGAKLVSIDNLGGEGLHIHDHTMKPDNIIKAASIFVKESVEYKVETSSSVLTTTVREEDEVIGRWARWGATTTAGVEEEEEEEEMGESGVKVIKLEYDSSKEVIELELGSFPAHNPHCPDCNHQITKIILHKEKLVPKPEVGIFEYYSKICVAVVKTVVSRLEMSIIIRSLRDSESGVIIHQFGATTGVEKEMGESGGVEVIALEYNPAKEVTELELGSFHAHTLHCPNCNHPITKIILRKMNIFRSGFSTKLLPVARITQHPAASQINGSGEKTTFNTTDGKHTHERRPATVQNPTSKKPALYNFGKINDKHVAAFNRVAEGVRLRLHADPDANSDDEIEEAEPVYEVSLSLNIRINFLMLLEILKCVVYGGLIESITSFSVVASAAATDATTLNVFAIGLAILFSGLIAFSLNLLELKNMKSNKNYREVLGKKKGQYYFAFHATLAILSYLVFGLIAPTTYAFAFREGDNRKGKILAAAAAAIACVFLLSMGKAYLSKEKDKLRCYIKTIRYYLGLAFFVSGVAYAMGFLVEMVALELGLFKSVQRVTCYAP